MIDPRAGNVTTVRMFLFNSTEIIMAVMFEQLCINFEIILQTFSGTQGNKDSRVCWLGNTDYIFGSGFDKVNR